MIKFFHNFFYRYPKINLGIYLVIITLSLLTLPYIKIGGEFIDFSSNNDQLKIDKEKIEAIFKAKNTVSLQIEYIPDGQIEELSKSLHSLERNFLSIYPDLEILGLHHFKKYFNLEKIKETDQSSMAIDKLSQAPLLRHLISVDKSKILLLLNFKQKDKIQTKKINKVIHKKYVQIKEIKAMGSTYIEEAVRDTIIKDLILLGSSVFIVSLLIICFSFRSFGAFLFSITVLMGSTLPIPLVLYLFDSKINVVNLLLIPIIMVLSLSDSIHLLNGITSAKGKDKFTESFKLYIIPSFYTSLTSSLAFLSFMTSDIETVRKFGMMSSVVVLLGFFSTFILCFFLSKFLKIEKNEMKKIYFFEKIISEILRGKYWISVILVILFSAGIVLSEKIEFNTSGIMFFPKNEPISKFHDEFNENFASLLGIDLVIYPVASVFGTKALDLETTKLLTYDIAKKIEQIQGVKAVSSLHEFIQYYYNKGFSADRGKSLDLYNPLLKNEYNRILIQLEDPDKSTIIYQKVLNILDEYKNQIRYYMFSPLALYEKTDLNLAKSLMSSMAISFIMIFSVFFLISRSFALSFVSLVVNFVTIGILGTLFYIFEMKLNIVTAMACIINIGIVVDDTIHVLYKTQENLNGLENLGYGMFITTITLSLEFFIFTFSYFQPTVIFGILSGSIVMIALFADLTLFPFLRERLKLNKSESS